MGTGMYKCPECGEINTEVEWDEATSEFIGEEALPLECCSVNDDCFYVCPSCNEKVGFEYIEELDWK